MKEKVLRAIREEHSDYDELETAIREFLKRELYLPLIGELRLDPRVLKNSLDDLISAIESGRIRYSRGRFTGRFSSTLSRELRRIGAEWDRGQGSFAVPQSRLPAEIKRAIALSESRAAAVMAKIDKRLAEIAPAELVEKLKLEKLFDRTIWKVEKRFQDSVKNITIAPKLTPDQRRRISEEYTKNMQLYIQDWTEAEIVKLRKGIQESAEGGLRYEAMAKTIETSYGTSVKKSRFLARQETSLLMTKFKQTRYEEAGVTEYIWGCVAGSPKHPVRPLHKRLDGKRFTWQNPPIVDEKGNRKNPGQDYGCRCFARPVVKF